MLKMKKKVKISLIISTLFLTACVNQMSRDHYLGTTRILNSEFYIERFRVYGGGVYGGDIDAIWVTDSLKIREYITTLNDHERCKIYIESNQCVVKIYKTNEFREAVYEKTILINL